MSIKVLIGCETSGIVRNAFLDQGFDTWSCDLLPADDMWTELQEGADLFSDLWNADVPSVAVENPVMHKHAKKLIRNYRPFAQSVQPYEFAENLDDPDNVTKRTCFWLKNLPKLEKTGTFTRATARNDIHLASPSPDRWKTRSRFHKGMAKAMADQWGNHVLTTKSLF